MANTDKDILITPNRGSSNEPKIEFKGASSAVGPSTITATIYPTNNGTLSFDGTEGSLFSIANNLTTGSIFSVNPISGIPIIDVNADRTIALNPYGGNTGIGLTNPSYKLDVSGSIRSSNQLISTVATGTAPFVVSSTTKVTNLNADYLDDQTGSYYLDYNNFTNTPTIGNGTITVQGTTGLTGTGSFTVNQTGNTTVTLNHADTSSQASVDNSNGTVIQDVTLDTYGHVTGLASTDLYTILKPSNDQNQVNINSPASSNGVWTTATSDEYGNPKFDSVYNEYRYADAPAWVQYNIPAGMKSAWISQLCWSDGGYVDVHGIQSGGQLVFLKRINTRQTVENTDEGVNHDGSTITFAASGLDDYSAIRFTVKSGRFYFTGLSFSTADNEGTEGVGMVHPAQISHQGSGSGLDADTVDGLNPSTSGTSNIVSRDASGNFSAGTITASLTGAASLNVLKSGDTMTGQLISTKANDTATGGGQIYLNGATGNRIDFNTNGVAAPAFTTRSAGTKLVLYPELSGSGVDYALGIESETMWFSVPQTTSRQFKWYAGTTNIGTLFGTGELVLGTTTKTGTASQRLQVTGGAYVSGNLGIGNTNPSYKLHINSGGSSAHALIAGNYNSTAASDHSRIYFNDTNFGIGVGNWGSVSDDDLYLWAFNGTGRDIRFCSTTDGSSAVNSGFWTTNVIIKNDGNFGISTTSPLQKLDVRGNFLLAADATTATHITQKPYTINGGTLSWEGSAGQLFSITNNLTSGSIFSVNDVSGLPSIDVDANGTIELAPYNGNVGVGTLTPGFKLDVNGTVGIRNVLGVSESGGGGNRLLISSSGSGAVFNQNDNSNIIFQTQGATRFTIAHSTGNITATGNATATNFSDGTGTYNVNLGSGGSEGRGLVAGYSGGSYGGIGYNVRHTTTGGQWIAPGTDTSSYLLFTAAGFAFYGAAAGAAGRTLSYTTLATLGNTGNLVASGSVSAAGASGFYSTSYVNNARNPIWRFANSDGYGFSYFQGTSGVSPTGGGDTLGFHFGTATAAASLLQLNNGTGIAVNGTTDNISANESGTSSAWRARILSKNSAADKSAFLGVYASSPGVFAHNHALNAWATLYVNTSNGTSDGGNVTIAGSSNVGIGEASPASKLTVRADSAGGRGGEISIVNYAATTVGNEAALNFGLENSTYNADLGNAQIKARVNNANAATDMIFSTWNGSTFGERVRLLSGGNFGISTNSPLQALDVRGNFLLAADATTATHITQKPYTVNGGTLSWEGSEGQLFSIANNLTTGSIFSVNPISGIPIIDVNADRTIALNPYGGNTGIGLTNPSYKLDVNGTARFSGQLTIPGNNSILFGPNSTWSRYLRIGGNGWAADSTTASVVTTDGNLHLDAADANHGIYLNWYGGTNGTFFGNGATGQIGRLDGSGNFSVSGTITGTQITSNIANGTAPFVVSSTTKVTNLNADYLDDLDSGSFLRSDAADSASGVIDFLGGSSTTPAIRIKSGGNSWSEGLAIHPASDNGYALTFYRTRASLTDSTNNWAIGNLGDNGTNNFGLVRNGLTGSAAIRVDTAFDVTQAGVFRFGFTPTVGSNTIWHAGNDGAGSGLDADLIDGVPFNNSNNTNQVSAPDSLDSNGIGYVTNISLYGQTDGALYSQAYSSAWQHQIYGDYRTGQIAIRGKNSGTWQSWRRVLDSASYSSSSAWTPNYSGISPSFSSPGKYTKTGGAANTWDSHVYSSEGYIDNLYVSFSPSQTNAHLMVGLNSDPTTDASYTSLDYAIYCTNSGTIEIYESNVQAATSLGSYATTDIFTITYDGKYVTYYKNNTILRQVARALSTTKLYLDNSFYTSSGSVDQLSFGTIGNNPYSTSSSRLYSTDATYEYFGSNPYYGYLTYVSANNRWRFQVSPATPAAVEVSYADSSGSASTATNISNSGTVTLASATESNSIYVSQPSYVTDQPVKLLNFDWYGNIWSLGNIRSGSTPSNGFGVYSSGTERARFTTSGLTVVGTTSSGVFTSTSDITKKTNIQNIKNAVELTKQINGVKFDWKETSESSAGVIAQEVEEVLPEIVHTNDEGIKSVNYNGVVGLLVEAIKEQQKQIDELKKELKKLHK